MSDAPLLQVIIAGTSKKTGAEIKKLSHLPASIFQISRSDAWNLTLSPDAARNMRDLAAQIGAGMPKYLIAPEVSLLLSYIDDLSIRMYFETLWNTGARLNEALALKPADFMLTPTRQYPQPVVKKKQKDDQDARPPGTHHYTLIRDTENHRSLL